ncbi:hypothetical protein GCM10023322_10030 [Rugosimonospora acidiphila]|uniref:Cas12f1-like TNB domain-containing protein n=1 Tax=Rugosimonospora acidiphila TaxID=556531 RepID=A0ABP9RKJ2_9ACTN
MFTAVAHLAAKAGIAVVRVPAPGTSSGCPRCGAALRHVKAPDRLVAGYRWAVCGCGLSADRDHAAAQRIAARGLTNQTTTRRDRTTGTGVIRTATDTRSTRDGPHGSRSNRGPAAPSKSRRDRRKTGPTRTQVQPRTLRSSPLLPLRRQAPAPSAVALQAATGKRPAGRLPQETHPGLQVPTTIPTRPHRVRDALLGHGLHRLVHPTPVPTAKRPNH